MPCIRIQEPNFQSRLLLRRDSSGSEFQELSDDEENAPPPRKNGEQASGRAGPSNFEHRHFDIFELSNEAEAPGAFDGSE